MIPITISEEILHVCPYLHVLAVAARVVNTPSNPELWDEIRAEEEEIRATVALEEINKWQPIAATRVAYRCFGKDPNRYRPSAESLLRRVVKGLSLYRIDTVVDLVNLVSLRSGFSIGGFDAEKIVGALRLGVGRRGEPYCGIGRGELNIEGLPVYRDRLGGIGTPTSDEERTRITSETSSLLLLINGYSGLEGLIDAGDYAIRLLRQYASAMEVEMILISAGGQAELQVPEEKTTF